MPETTGKALSDDSALTETEDTYGAYPRLPQRQLDALIRVGNRRDTSAGDVVFCAGDVDYPFVVVLKGLVALVDDSNGARIISAHGPGRFLGEIGMLVGEASLLSAAVEQPGAVLEVPVTAIRELVTEDSTLGDLILRAFFLRRQELIEEQAGLRILGSRYSPSVQMIREFVARNHFPHRFIDLELDTEGEALLRQFHIAPDETPIVIVAGNIVLRNPGLSELARILGLPTASLRRADFDLAVVGGGPAGLAAAVYGASEGLNTVCLDALATGGQAGTSSRIENYLGFPAGISGAELAARAVIQAAKFNTTLLVPAEVTGLRESGGHWELALGDGGKLSSRSVIIATGAKYRRLDVPDLDRFEGSGVFYAATLTEAMLCSRAPAAIVGGGNSAGQAALFLARYASRVYLIVRASDLDKTMSRYLIDRIKRHPRIDLRLETEVRAAIGGSSLSAVEVEQTSQRSRERLDIRYLFVFIGAAPNTEWLDQITLDEHGFVLTGDEIDSSNVTSWSAMGRTPSHLETSSPGVFAAGDVRSNSVKRVAAAVGEGAMAVYMVHRYLDERGEQFGQLRVPTP